MSDYIDTRRGWRRADPENEYIQLVEYDEMGATAIGWWVKVRPVPPLPTTPRTHVVVTWRNGRTEEWIRQEDKWLNYKSGVFVHALEELGEIQSWQQLVEPLVTSLTERDQAVARETAIDIISRLRRDLPMRAANESIVEEIIYRIATDYGAVL